MSRKPLLPIIGIASLCAAAQAAPTPEARARQVVGMGHSAADWPQSMGPERTGFTPETIAPSAVDMPGGPPVAWRADAGLGGASPVVVAGVVYAIGAFESGKEPGADSTPKITKIPGHWAPKNPDGTTPRVLGDIWVSAFSVADGAVLWRSKASTEKITQLLHANASPLWDQGTLYVRTPQFAAALDAKTGQIKWTFEFSAQLGETLYWMQGRTPPLMAEGKLILTTHVVTQWWEQDTNAKEQHAVCFALDPATGALLWKHETSPNNIGTYDPVSMPNETGYLSWEPATGFGLLDGKPTVVMSTGHAAIGLNPATGERRWIFHHAEQIDSIKAAINTPESTGESPAEPNLWVWWAHYGYVPPQVIVRDGIVIERVFCGHGTLGTMTAGFGVAAGKPKLLWTTDQLQSRNAKFVVHDGRLYGMDLYDHLHTIKKGRPVEWPRPHRPDDVGQFQCRDIRTGKLLWSSDEIYQGDKAPPASFICEGKSLSEAQRNPDGPTICPLLNDRLRSKPTEGGYSYNGDPTYILAGDTLVVKSARASFYGLQFAKVKSGGLAKIGERSFYPGYNFFGEPVVANGRLFLKLNDAENGLEPGQTGTLVCFGLGN